MTSRLLRRGLPPGLEQLALRVALRLAPGRHHAVVSGTPDDEGNCVEVVRRLAERLPVYWITAEDPAAYRWVIEGLDTAHPVRAIRKDSMPAYLAYLTARFVFFTHGLYGSPPPPRHKVFVNMWHGDGPKLSKGFAHVRSTYAVAGTRLWGEQRPVYFGVDPAAVLVTGHPRIDQLARPPAGAALKRLGLDPDRPFVLWMPTYRSSEYLGVRVATQRHGTDADRLSNQQSVIDLGGELAGLADRVGVQVVIKPHPLDRDEYTGLGLPVVDTEDLRREHLTVYQLMGASAGLITDYSSVWTDFLALDRPVGVYCPDLEQYEALRGLNVPDYLAIVPGPRLGSLADFEAFLRECLRPSPESRAIRARSAERVGAETRLGATDRLFEAVGVPGPPAATVRLPQQRSGSSSMTRSSTPSAEEARVGR